MANKKFTTLSDQVMTDPDRAARVAEHEAAIRESLDVQDHGSEERAVDNPAGPIGPSRDT